MPKNKAWTVMVYLAGDNNLSEECVYGLVEMKKANCDREKINIIAQFDSSDEFLPTRRYEINRGNGKLSEDIIAEAEFNPRTREVHFKNESTRANALARNRQKLKRESISQAIRAQREGIGINQPPPPDATRGGLDDTDTASRIQLYNFLSFCVQKYPADHYMVVLSGHGAGTERDYFLKDEGSSGYLTFNELKAAFQQVIDKDLPKEQKIDIIGLDSCLMSMAEVSYELRDFANITVGCESYAPAAGWPYRSILEALNGLVKDPVADDQKAAEIGDVASQLARAIVEKYVAFYADYAEGGLSVTQSALNLSQLTGLKDGIKTLVDTLLTEFRSEAEGEKAGAENGERPCPFRDALILAHWEAQSYNGESYVDIADFCECLARRYQGGEVARVCRDVVEFINGKFVLASCFNGSVYQYSNGVSIYFPWSTVALYYLNLDFADDSGWAEFLATYVDLTRRAPRTPPFSKTSGIAHRDLVDSNARLSRRQLALALGRQPSNAMAAVTVAPGQASVGSGVPGKMGSGKMGSGKMGSGKMGSGKEGNPIHSMRNPPIGVAEFACKFDYDPSKPSGA